MVNVPASAAGASARDISPAHPGTLFPSVAWFQLLADRMNDNRARQEQLGYVDCIAGFRVIGADGSARTFEVAFEEFSATGVCEAGPDGGHADFVLEAPFATWREMIESIASGRGRPDLSHTLNHLSHLGTPVRLLSDDPLKSDLYFRYNQSLQEFVNASATIASAFGPS